MTDTAIGQAIKQYKAKIEAKRKKPNVPQ